MNKQTFIESLKNDWKLFQYVGLSEKHFRTHALQLNVNDNYKLSLKEVNNIANSIINNMN